MKHGDFDAAWAKAAVKVDQTYTMTPQNHNPMEPHATIALWRGDDQVTLYDTTQGGFIVRDKIATLFGLPKENVRVISHFLGGGFGGKGAPWSHVALCAMAAKVARRPVKLVLARQQMFHFVGHRARRRSRGSAPTEPRSFRRARTISGRARTRSWRRSRPTRSACRSTRFVSSSVTRCFQTLPSPPPHRPRPASARR
jgi:CO/xanthine dehydrogenase Mo-binding subunit